MISVDDHVTYKNTTHPIGIIKAVNGNLSATVRWGVADNHIYEEEIPQDQLQLVPFDILSPDDVILNQAEKAALHKISGEKN